MPNASAIWLRQELWTQMNATFGFVMQGTCLSSVSYTHLDVYKRQAMRCGRTPTSWISLSSTKASKNSARMAPLAVSYTHLDVYKRQPFGRLKAPLGLSLLRFAAQTRTFENAPLSACLLYTSWLKRSRKPAATATCPRTASTMRPRTPRVWSRTCLLYTSRCV